MPSQTSSNHALDDTFVSAHEYNKLPHIDDMHETAGQHNEARMALLSLIAKHGVGQKFSVHLVHKHFDAPANRVMVYETIKAVDKVPFMLFTPMNPETCDKQLRGLYYRARSDGVMAAYEYTADEGPDVSMCGSFVAEFAAMCIAYNVENIFALTVKSPSPIIWSEFEYAAYASTILIPEGTWFPGADSEDTITTATNWTTPDANPAALSKGEGVPGIIELKCTKTRARHHNFTCSKTRSGTHFQKKKNPNGYLGSRFSINEVDVPEDSPIFSIMDRATQMIEAY